MLVSKTKQLYSKFIKKQKAYCVQYQNVTECPSLDELEVDKTLYSYARNKTICFTSKKHKRVYLRNALKMLFLNKKEAKRGFLKALKRNRKYLIAYINRLQGEVDKIDKYLRGF